MIIRKALGLALLFLLTPPGGAQAAGKNRFAGCAGLSVTRTNDFSTVDVSRDLNRANRRIQQICGKVIPKKLEAIEANAQACLAGASQEIGPGLASSMKHGMQNQMQAFQHRIREACESMEKTMKESQRFCDDRKAKLDELNREISPLAKSGNDQLESERKAVDLYGKARAKYLELAAQAKASAETIYSYLPDKDERRAEQMRRGNESASTRDYKTDRLIERWKSSLTLFAKGNKNKAACTKLKAKGGELDDLGGVLKNNLWPNGKVAARAIVRIEGADEAKAQEFAGKKAEAEKLAAASGLREVQDKREYERVSGISEEKKAPEGPRKLTQDDFFKMKKADEEAQKLQAKAIKIYKESGASGPGAVDAALAQAKKTQELPEDYRYVSPARAAVDGKILPDVVPGSVQALDQDLRSPATANIPEKYVPAVQIPCATREWSWWSFSYVEKKGYQNSLGACIVN